MAADDPAGTIMGEAMARSTRVLDDALDRARQGIQAAREEGLRIIEQEQGRTAVNVLLGAPGDRANRLIAEADAAAQRIIAEARKESLRILSDADRQVMGLIVAESRNRTTQ